MIYPKTGKDIPFKPMAQSENDRMRYMFNTSFEGKTMTINVDSSFKIVGVVIKYNSFKRLLTLTPKNFTYTWDIGAFNKNINVLAE